MTTRNPIKRLNPRRLYTILSFFSVLLFSLMLASCNSNASSIPASPSTTNAATPTTSVVESSSPTPSAEVSTSPLLTPSLWVTEGTPTYFSPDEAMIGKADIAETTIDELIELYGEPDENLVFNNFGESYTLIQYGHVKFSFKHSSLEGRLISANIGGETDMQLPRDIQVGDSLESVMAKFPQEREYNGESIFHFYGDMLDNSAGGTLYKDSDCKSHITVMSENVDPYMNLFFIGDELTEIYIGCRWT